MTAYELRISDGSSDVCSSDLLARHRADRSGRAGYEHGHAGLWLPHREEAEIGGQAVGRIKRHRVDRIHPSLYWRDGHGSLVRTQYGKVLPGRDRRQPLPLRKARVTRRQHFDRRHAPDRIAAADRDAIAAIAIG